MNGLQRWNYTVFGTAGLPMTDVTSAFTATPGACGSDAALSFTTDLGGVESSDALQHFHRLRYARTNFRTDRRTLTMAWLRLFLLIFISIPSFAGCIDIFLGDPVEFSDTGNCKTSGSRLEHRLLDDSVRRVADLDGVWQPRPEYEDRMSPNHSVIFNSTNINDSGKYELTCGSQNQIIPLRVNDFSEVSVTDGDAVKLPFHSITVGKRGEFRLERNGELVFGLAVPSGEISEGTGAEGPGSVSPDWRTHGDLSLSFSSVKPEHRGDYIYYYQDKDNTRPKEYLHGVRLTVNKRTDKIYPTPPTVTLTQKQDKVAAPVSVGVIVGPLVGIVTALALGCVCWLKSAEIVCWLKSRRSNVTSGAPTDVEMALMTPGGPAGSQGDGA